MVETARPSDPRKATNNVTDSGVMREMGKAKALAKDKNRFYPALMHLIGRYKAINVE